MSNKITTSTEVEIFGGVYPVRGQGEAEDLQQLARTVDAKMREIARHISTRDTAKVAVLTALNLADELSQLRNELEGERTEVRERITDLSQQLEQALQTP